MRKKYILGVMPKMQGLTPEVYIHVHIPVLYKHTPDSLKWEGGIQVIKCSKNRFDLPFMVPLCTLMFVLTTLQHVKGEKCAHQRLQSATHF